MDRRRILMLFGVAWISAAALTWFLYATTKKPREQAHIDVFAANRDLPVGTMIRKADLKKMPLLERDVPKNAVLIDGEALNHVVLYPVSGNEPLTMSKLSTVTGVEGIMATLEHGYRAVSVPISDASGVAGLIQPGSRVDVLFTRPGSMTEAITSTILQNVKVLAIGKLVQAGQTADPKAPKAAVATLVVTPEQAQKLELAKNEGKISLSARNPRDSSSDLDGSPVTTEVLDPLVSARLARARKGHTTTAMNHNFEDPAVWQELTGQKKNRDKEKEEEEARRKKEAEKPRAVVDVYRGEKHVQEIFHE